MATHNHKKGKGGHYLASKAESTDLLDLELIRVATARKNGWQTFELGVDKIASKFKVDTLSKKLEDVNTNCPAVLSALIVVTSLVQASWRFQFASALFPVPLIACLSSSLMYRALFKPFSYVYMLRTLVPLLYDTNFSM